MKPKSPKLNTIITQDKLPGPRQKIHIVKTGENMASIAKLYSVSIGELEFWNKIRARSKLFPNQEIIIWKHSNSSKANTHKVVYGDTLDKISRQHNTSIQDLKILNNLKDDKIIAGQILKI